MSIICGIALFYIAVAIGARIATSPKLTDKKIINFILMRTSI